LSWILGLRLILWTDNVSTLGDSAMQPLHSALHVLTAAKYLSTCNFDWSLHLFFPSKCLRPHQNQRLKHTRSLAAHPHSQHTPPSFPPLSTAAKHSISSPSSSESIVLLSACSPGHTFEVLRHDTPVSRITVKKKTASSRPLVKPPPHKHHINPARNAKRK